jgi:hypothetical protein
MGHLVLVGEVIRELEQLGGASFNFGPKYFADLDLADRERIRVAKRLAGDCALARQLYFEKLRLYCQEGATHCAYCMNAHLELRYTRAIGDRLLHLGCADKFDAEYREWSAALVEITPAGRAALREESRIKLCVGCRQAYRADPTSELSFCASCEALQAPHAVAQ